MKEEQPKQKFYLQVNSDLKSLGHVLEWFTKNTRSYLSEHYFLQCQTMLAEGFTNAVRHAHKNYPPQTLIKIELFLYNRYLEIKIWDTGKPFDLKEKLDVLLQKKEKTAPVDLAEGGRGLQFINALADQFQYIRDIKQERNCLVMQKFFE